ncbi:MAG: MXAN_5187 C-terminal domain-containing protein [Kofleriaceae bacterium]
MSRTVIAAVVAAVIVVLAAIAYFVTSKSFDERAKKDADAQLNRAHGVIGQVNQLEGIDVANKAEWLASFPEFLSAIKSENVRASQARIGFQKFTADEKKSPIKPDIIALLDKTGNVLAISDVPSVVAKQWKNDKGESILPAINVVLKKKIIISDIWIKDEKSMFKVGVAPILDPEAVIPPEDTEGAAAIVGAIVVAYSQTAKETQKDKSLLGTDLAYYNIGKGTDGKAKVDVIASSFTRANAEEDTAKAVQLATELGKLSTADGKPLKAVIAVGETTYIAATFPLPRAATKAFPTDYPPVTSGVVVLSPIGGGETAAMAGTVKLFILLLGIGALAIAMLGLYLSHRRLITQVDQVELGITEIINGNLDRTFRPVGPELDGLSNGLNVMLARLLGRPEPGEEEFDEEGNPIVPGRVDFEEGEEKPAVDPDIAALAQEAEPDYYKRVYTEYTAARKASGNPDDVSFENFIAKLKVNEGKLKAQYQCRAVRFRVVTKDGKVSLKPVPIFA